MRDLTGQTTTEILTRAIDRLHEDMVATDAKAAFASFIGCGSAEPGLSQDYKTALSQTLHLKHDHR